MTMLMLKNEFKIFIAAVMFYTRIPCPDLGAPTPEIMSKSARYFPLIGWIVGTISYFAFFISTYIFNNEISIIISLVSAILLTGAFHEDGFADTCDGFWGGHTRQKILEIMKDSRIGTYGVVGLILLFGIKIYSLLSVVNLNVSKVNTHIFLLLLFITSHSMSRLAAISIKYTHNYAGDSTKSKCDLITRHFSWREIAGSFSFGLIPLVILSIFYIQILYVLIPILAIRFYLSSFFKKRIGGYTGDCLGATQQVCETIFYLSVIGIWKFT